MPVLNDIYINTHMNIKFITHMFKRLKHTTSIIVL